MLKKTCTSKSFRVPAILMILAISTFAVTACSVPQIETVFAKTIGNAQENIIYYSTGDIVIKQVNTLTNSYEALGIRDIDEARELLEPLDDDFKKMVGVTRSVEYGATLVTLRFTIDYLIADRNEISNNSAENSKEITDNNDNISLKKLRAIHLADGFTEVK